MDKRVLANSIDGSEIARVAHDIVSDRWDNWDLTEFLAYLVDTVAPDALPYLAEQFDVDGLRGFEMAGNEAAQRELIKISIKLHKFMGTVWAIRKACETVGLPDMILIEGVPSNPPNPDTDWARFSLLLDIPGDQIMDTRQFANLRAFVNQYKPERCHLAELGVWLKFVEKERLFRPIFQENLDIQINGEQMTYWVVIIDDADNFSVDDNSDIIINT